MEVRLNRQKKAKKRTLSTEITLLTVLTSVCAILVLGTLLILIFFFFFSQKAKEDMEYILKNTSQQFRDKIQYIEDGAIAVRHNMALRDFFFRKIITMKRKQRRSFRTVLICFPKEIW